MSKNNTYVAAVGANDVAISCKMVVRYCPAIFPCCFNKARKNSRTQYRDFVSLYLNKVGPISLHKLLTPPSPISKIYINDFFLQIIMS